jgi:hypothetical protein
LLIHSHRCTLPTCSGYQTCTNDFMARGVCSVGMLTDGVLMTQAYTNGHCTAPANADTGEPLLAPAALRVAGRCPTARGNRAARGGSVRSTCSRSIASPHVA